jgi:hypothetical protein
MVEADEESIHDRPPALVLRTEVVVEQGPGDTGACGDLPCR